MLYLKIPRKNLFNKKQVKKVNQNINKVKWIKCEKNMKSRNKTTKIRRRNKWNKVS